MSNFSAIQPFWSSDLALGDEPKLDWIWQGYIAPGNVTLLTGLWKAGKTTLLAVLLARRKNGGKLAGLDVKPGKTLVVTEENSSLWTERFRRHHYSDQVCLISRPFNSIPTEEEWRSLLDQVRAMRDRHAIDLLIIDPLAPFLRDENNAKNVLDYLMPLCQLTKTGMAVLATHHPARAERALGHSARGSGAILAQVDIALELRLPGSDYLTRRRRIIGLSRHTDTPRHLLLELNADATDYLVLPDEPEDGFDAHWHILQFIFDDAADMADTDHMPTMLSRREIHARWPEDQPRPALNTLRDWLQTALDRNLITRSGSGRRSDPYRFALPETDQAD